LLQTEFENLKRVCEILAGLKAHVHTTNPMPDSDSVLTFSFFVILTFQMPHMRDVQN